LGSCIVLESAITRGALTAIHWLAPPAYPIAIVGTMPEGYAASARDMEKAGLTLHADHEARRAI
jgi:hypothetical protein